MVVKPPMHLAKHKSHLHAGHAIESPEQVKAKTNLVAHTTLAPDHFLMGFSTCGGYGTAVGRLLRDFVRLKASPSHECDALNEKVRSRLRGREMGRFRRRVSMVVQQALFRAYPTPCKSHEHTGEQRSDAGG